MLMHDKTDLQIQALAVGMWANHIETGSVSMSAQDAKNCKKPFNALDAHQMAMVVRFRNLVTHLLREDSQNRLGAKLGVAPAVAIAEPVPPVAAEPSFAMEWVPDKVINTDLILKVGRISFAKIQSRQEKDLQSSQTSTSVHATFFLKGIAEDQGLHRSVDEAKSHLERAAKGWLKALMG